MNIHRLLILSAAASLLGLGSCTARYQDMIRDRDETIRDLEGRLSSTRDENQKLKREIEGRESDLIAAKSQLRAMPASSTKNDDELESVKRALKSSGIGDEEVSARMRRGKLSLGIANQVTFSPGSTDLSKSGKAVLDRLASLLQSRFAGKSIWVEGHTDSDPIQKTKGKYRSNRHLSSERADAVATYLVSRGIPSDHVVIVGHGPNDPVDRNRKDSNRRVEIVVSDSND